VAITTNLFGTADSASGWAANTGTKWGALNSDDGDTSYINPITVNPETYTSEMDNLPASAHVIVGGITHYYKARKIDPYTGSFYGLIYDTGYQNGANNSPWTTSYVLYSDAYATATGSVAWEVASINSLKAGVYSDADAGQAANFRVTYRYVTVVWRPGIRSWTSSIFEVLPFLVGAGAGLIASEVPKMLRLYNATARGRHRIDLSDAPEVFRCFREAKNPAYVFL